MKIIYKRNLDNIEFAGKISNDEIIQSIENMSAQDSMNAYLLLGSKLPTDQIVACMLVARHLMKSRKMVEVENGE
jgi:protein-arginine kinase